MIKNDTRSLVMRLVTMIKVSHDLANVDDELKAELTALYPTGLPQHLFLIKRPMPKGSKVQQYNLYEEGDVVLNFYPKGTPVVEEEEHYILPALYKRDHTGTEIVWKIWVTQNTVNKTWGDCGGKMQYHSRNYSGVNEAKANATTDREQAMREAERDWIKYLDKGYRPKSKKGKELADRVLKEKAKQGNVNINVYTVIRGLVEPQPVKGAKAKKAKSKSSTASSTVAKKVAKISKSVAAKKEIKAKLKATNGTLPGFEVDHRPMHAQTWTTEPKCLKYFDFKKGVWIQPKLDGIRAHVRLVVKNGVNTS